MVNGQMDNLVENNGEVQFANGQSNRDLRVSPERRMQLMEAVDRAYDLFLFIEISTRVNAIKQRRLF
jgi:hypothetical protein